MPITDRRVRVFLCHASQDKPIVRELYRRFLVEGWIDPWLDEEKLLPGQDWDMEIKKAVEAADAVVVCLSANSITKEGYVQKELRSVLDVAEYKPEGAVFIIPVRLEECLVPPSLKSYHYVDLFTVEQMEKSYQRLLDSLEGRAGAIGVNISAIKEQLQKAAEENANLPDKTYRRFVGRSDQIDLIKGAFREQGSRSIVAVIGLGGIGKTALAREAVDQSLQEKLFDHIVWISFKSEEFVSEDIVKTGTPAHSFDELLSEIGRQCNQLGITKIPVDQRRAAVKNLLVMHRVLVVMDNLETVRNNEELVVAVSKVLGTSKLLVTSRHHLKNEHVFTVDLKGFTEDEGVDFLSEHSKARNIKVVVQANRPQLVEIHNATGGAPLAMRLVIGQMSRQPMDIVLATLKEAAFKGQDYPFYRFVYQHSWKMLDMNARQALVAMSVFPPNIGGTKEEVQAISQIEPSLLWRAMGELITLSLVDKIGVAGQEVYALHPLTQNFILADITKEWTVDERGL